MLIDNLNSPYKFGYILFKNNICNNLLLFHTNY